MIYVHDMQSTMQLENHLFSSFKFFFSFFFFFPPLTREIYKSFVGTHASNVPGRKNSWITKTDPTSQQPCISFMHCSMYARRFVG